MTWQIRPLALLFMLFLPSTLRLSAQVAAFTIPDTVCVNTPVHIANTSLGGTSWYWNFCVADIGKTPEAVNLGNIGGTLSSPVFMDMDSVNNHFYGFVVNNFPGGLIRLDYGNSLLNTPIATDLGSLGGVIPPGAGAEGVQIVKNNGNYYVIVVGWNLATTGNPAKIIQVSFGPDLGNPAPTATDWGNLGGLEQPIDLYIFKENSNWYGFTVNGNNNTITRFDFGTSFDTPPMATNLGNPGGMLNYPTGICAVNDGGSWRVFITNAYTSLIRLDFGSSLLNTPVPVSLGNPGNTLSTPRDISVLKFCDQAIGFFVNQVNNDIVRLDFGNDLSAVPAATSLGNIGQFSFPHSLSKLFRVGADLYCFVTNVSNNTITRLKFAGCTNASLPNTALKDPPDIIYDAPGTYNIHLNMDDGLATAGTFCKTLVVVGPPAIDLGNDKTLCQGDSLVLHYSGTELSYTWQDGSSLDSFVAYNTGQVKLAINTSHGCYNADSVVLQFTPLPVINSLPDTAICQGTSLLLTTKLQFQDAYNWTPADGLPDPSVLSPLVRPSVTTRYIINAYNQGCPGRDTILVSLKDTPTANISPDTLLCKGGTASLLVTGADHYRWSPVKGLSDPTVADPKASPDSSTYYHVLATGINTCTTTDSILVKVKDPDRFVLSPSPANLCRGDTILLTVKADKNAVSDTYTWLSDIGAQDPHLPELTVSPLASGLYQIKAVDNICNTQSVLTVNVNVMDRPSVSLTKSNDIDCIYGQVQLAASGDGLRYAWTPAETLSNPQIADPIARTDTNTLYQVLVTGENGCTTLDSITVLATKEGGTIGFPVANAFTPNGDGNNDCFGIKYWGYIGDFEMSVFDRWGLRVYSSKDPYQCWDGRFRGQPQPAGTYVYTIRAIARCGIAVRKGTVTLIR